MRMKCVTSSRISTSACISTRNRFPTDVVDTDEYLSTLAAENARPVTCQACSAGSLCWTVRRTGRIFGVGDPRWRSAEIREERGNVSRYAGNPLLRLLELYVLWSIGELNSNDDDLLQQMTPRLRETYSHNGTWFEIIESVMELPVAARQEIVELWKRARAVDPSAQAFAERFVDQT